MSSYRRLWWVVVLAAGVPAATLGMAMSPILGVVVTVTGMGLLAGAGVVLVPGSGHAWRELVCVGILVVAAAPALGGFTIPLLLLGVLTSPSLAGRVWPRSSAVTPDAPVATELTVDTAHDVEAFLGALDGRALCDLWSSSFVRLKSAPTADERAAAVALRRDLLDEMERRNSGTFAAWLAKSPSPASAPGWRIASPESGATDE